MLLTLYNFRVRVFQKDGSFVLAWGSEGSENGQFIGPIGVAVADNYVYVSDETQVQVFNKAGDCVRVWSSEGIGNGEFSLQGMVADGSRLYVLDDSGCTLFPLKDNKAYRILSLTL